MKGRAGSRACHTRKRYSFTSRYEFDVSQCFDAETTLLECALSGLSLAPRSNVAEKIATRSYFNQRSRLQIMREQRTSTRTICAVQEKRTTKCDQVLPASRCWDVLKQQATVGRPARATPSWCNDSSFSDGQAMPLDCPEVIPDVAGTAQLSCRFLSLMFTASLCSHAFPFSLHQISLCTAFSTASCTRQPLLCISFSTTRAAYLHLTPASFPSSVQSYS